MLRHFHIRHTACHYAYVMFSPRHAHAAACLLRHYDIAAIFRYAAAATLTLRCRYFDDAAMMPLRLLPMLLIRRRCRYAMRFRSLFLFFFFCRDMLIFAACRLLRF